MPVRRGLVPSAIATSTVVMVVCAVSWGALGVLSAEGAAMSTPLHRYLCTLLETVTVGSLGVYLAAQLMRVILRCATGYADGGYAAGYADGLDARPGTPAVSRLVPTRR